MIIIEALSAGSTFEDIRVGMLLNTYAAALARVSMCVVITIGPRATAIGDHLLTDFIKADTLTISRIDALVHDARGRVYAQKDDQWLRQQIGLFYPVLPT
ncbi:MAG: hypothetical protein JOZ51_12910 [Chloroflexi bacterium]|nr:hypothetical protein [Chloroflexota bacterium]